MKILKNTLAISGEILNIINQSKKNLYLVSPFVQLEKDDESEFFKDKLKDAIEGAIRKSVDVKFLSKTSNEDKKVKIQEVLKDFTQRDCSLFLLPNLHSKIYCNESTVLITSMNMFLYSVLNNEEIGVLIEKEDKVQNVIEYIESLISKAEKFEKIKDKQKSWKKDYEVYGYCVVCGENCEFDPELKLMVCEKHAKVEKEYYDGDYCHLCGKKGNKLKPTMPLCKNCYYQYLSIGEYHKSNSINS